MVCKNTFEYCNKNADQIHFQLSRDPDAGKRRWKHERRSAYAMRRRRGDEEGKEEGVAMKREKDNTFIIINEDITVCSPRRTIKLNRTTAPQKSSE